MGCTELVWHKIAHSNYKSYLCWNHHLLVHFPLRPILTKGNFVLLSLSATLFSNFHKKKTLMRYLKSHIRFKWVSRYFSSRSGHVPLKIEWSSTFKPSLFSLSSKIQSSSSCAMSWRILSFAVSAACLLILVGSGGWHSFVACYCLSYLQGHKGLSMSCPLWSNDNPRTTPSFPRIWRTTFPFFYSPRFFSSATNCGLVGDSMSLH